MADLIQQLINGLSLGGLYALLALGLAIVFSTTGLVNFAHGELITIAGYTMLWLLAADVPFIWVVPGAVVGSLLLALAMERVVFRPLRGANVESLMIASFGIAVIVQIALQNIAGPRVRVVSSPAWMGDTISVGSLQIGVLDVLTIVVTALLLVLLTVFLRKTIVGIGIRAAGSDFLTTRLMGISANRMIVTAFALSGVLAGIAGVLYVVGLGSVTPGMGLSPVVKAFLATIIGGLGSLSGAVAGGLFLGFSEVLLQSNLPDSAQPYRDAIVLVIAVAVLLLRPQGVLGTATGDRS